MTPDRGPDHNGWYNEDVTFDTEGTDATSGIDTCDPDYTWTTALDGDGTNLTRGGSCTDNAGNAGTGTSALFKFDDTDPSVSVALDLLPDPGTGWFNIGTGAPTAEFTCSDATAGIFSCPADHLFGDGANQSHTGAAFDNAGNSNSATVSDVDVDTVAPGVTVTPDRGPDHNGWYNEDVTFDTEGTDATSGIDTCDPDYTWTTALDGDGTNLTRGGSCTDNAGNSGTGTSATFKFDDSDPTSITFAGGGITPDGSYHFGFVPAGPSSCNANYAISGSAGCVVTGPDNGNAVGPNKYTATATDQAGNVGTSFLNYTVLAWTLQGFFQPVDMGGVYNTVKNGSTVPLKFRIFAGTTEITDVAAVSYVKFIYVTCSSTTPTDAIEEVVTTGGTVLRYTGGQFIDNWKTPSGGSQVGKCLQVQMKTDDGSSLYAWFKLK